MAVRVEGPRRSALSRLGDSSIKKPCASDASALNGRALPFCGAHTWDVSHAAVLLALAGLNLLPYRLRIDDTNRYKLQARVQAAVHSRLDSELAHIPYKLITSITRSVNPRAMRNKSSLAHCQTHACISQLTPGNKPVLAKSR